MLLIDFDLILNKYALAIAAFIEKSPCPLYFCYYLSLSYLTTQVFESLRVRRDELLCFRDFSQDFQCAGLENVKFAWFFVTFCAALRMKLEYIVALSASSTSDAPTTTSSAGLATATHVTLVGIPRHSRAWPKDCDPVL